MKSWRESWRIPVSSCKAIASSGVEEVFYVHQKSMRHIIFGLIAITSDNDNRNNNK